MKINKELWGIKPDQKTEAEAKKETPEIQKSPEILKNQIENQAAGAVANFQKENNQRLEAAETRAASKELTIDSNDKNALSGLAQEAETAKQELFAKISERSPQMPPPFTPENINASQHIIDSYFPTPPPPPIFEDYLRVPPPPPGSEKQVTPPPFPTPPPLPKEFSDVPTEKHFHKPERMVDVDSFLKEVNDFLAGRLKKGDEYSACRDILKPYMEGEKALSAVLGNEQTAPFALEMARRIMSNKFTNDQKNLSAFISEEIINSLPELEKQLHRNTQHEQRDDLSPTSQRRFLNNSLFLVSEATKHPNFENRQKADQWLLQHSAELQQSDPYYITGDGLSDFICQDTFINIISNTENRELFNKTLQTAIEQDILPISDIQYSLSEDKAQDTSFDNLKEVAEFLAEKLGLSRKIVGYWQKSRVFHREGTDGTKIFRPSYKENLEAAQALEESLPGSTEKLFKQFGIANFSRYSKDMLLRQLRIEDSNVPYGVVVMPEADHNGAFAQNANHLDKMTEQLNAGGLEARIIEVASQRELARRLSIFNKKYGSEHGHKINFLVIGGHGEPGGIELGEKQKMIPPPIPGVMPDEEYRRACDQWLQQLDGDPLRRKMLMDDLQEGVGHGIRRAAAEWFEKGAPVVLISCSTGAEGGIAQKISKELSFETIAPNRPTNIQSIDVSFDKTGKPAFNVEYHKGDNDAQAMRYYAGQRVEQV